MRDQSDISAAAAALGRKGGSAKSPAKAAASAANGRQGGPPGRYYAVHWYAGVGATLAATGDDAIRIVYFQTREDRDATARQIPLLEPVQASDPRVRAALRGAVIPGSGGLRASAIEEWGH